MNLSTTPASEDERGVSISRAGPRNVASVLAEGFSGGGGGGSGGISSGGISSGRKGFGSGSGGEKRGAALATLDMGARVSPALAYGKIASLPQGDGGIGVMRGR